MPNLIPDVKSCFGKWKLDKYSGFTYKLGVHNCSNKAAPKQRADYSQLPGLEKHLDTHEIIILLNKLNSPMPLVKI